MVADVMALDQEDDYFRVDRNLSDLCGEGNMQCWEVGKISEWLGWR